MASERFSLRNKLWFQEIKKEHKTETSHILLLQQRSTF